jgi:hypothetical protein
MYWQTCRKGGILWQQNPKSPEAVQMKDSIEKVIRDLGTIRIENLISMEEPQPDSGLYPEEYDPRAGRYLYSETEGLRFFVQKGGNHHAKKKSSSGIG